MSRFSEIILFKNDLSKTELLFKNPDYSTQRAVQAIAHSLDLEYEFSLASRDARITRRVPTGVAEITSQNGEYSSARQQQDNETHPSDLSTSWPLDNDPFPDSDQLFQSFDSWLQDSTTTLDSETNRKFINANVSGSGVEAGASASSAGGQGKMQPDSNFTNPVVKHGGRLPEGEYDDMYSSNNIFASESSLLRTLDVDYERSLSPPPQFHTPGPGNISHKTSTFIDGQEIQEITLPTGVEPHGSDCGSSDQNSRRNLSRGRSSLNTIARASTTAVKVFFACWRCRFLKSKVGNIQLCCSVWYTRIIMLPTGNSTVPPRASNTKQ